MQMVQEIELAISRLSLEELTHFREWFDAFEAKIWDKQFEADAKSGKLDKFAAQVADFHAGKCKEL